MALASKFVIAPFTVLLFFLSPFPAFSQFQYQFTPSVSVFEDYNDNINASATGKESDYITGLSPGISLDILTQNTTLGLQYAPTFVFYKYNKQNNTTRQLSTLNWNQRLSEHMNFNITNTFYLSDQPIEYDPSVIGVRTNRQTYWRDIGRANFNILYGPQNSLSFGYSLNVLKNEDPTIADGSIQVPSATWTHWFNVQNGIQLNYGYVEANFRRDQPPQTIIQVFQNDYTGNNAGVRYIHQFGPQTSAFIDYGYADRSFDGPTPDYKVNQASAGFDHTFSPETTLSLSGGYLLQDNEFFGDIGGYVYNMQLSRQFQYGNFVIGGVGGWRENYLDAQRFGFTRYESAYANLGYQATERLSFSASGSWRLDRDNLGFDWTTAQGNVGLTWTFLQFLSLSLNYRYGARRSDIPGDEFTINSIVLTLSAARLYQW